jgi:hypothetical protein
MRKKGDSDAVRFGLLAVQTGRCKDTTIQMCTIYLRLSPMRFVNFDRALSYANKAMSIAIKYRSIVDTELHGNSLSFLFTFGTEAESLESIHLGQAAIEKPWSQYDSITSTCLRHHVCYC